MDHFDKTSIASKLKMQVARKKLNEAFKQTPFYKSMMAAVDKIYKLDKSIQEAVEEAKKDGAIK
jgi:thymidine kinase